MKGISTIIAVVMLLMITVALAALFWVFSNDVFGSVSGGVAKQTNSSIVRAGSEFAIINARNNSLTVIDVTIRNSGTQSLDLSTLVAFVDDRQTTDNVAVTLAPGDASSFTVTLTPPFSMSKCNHVLRVSMSYAQDEYAVINCQP